MNVLQDSLLELIRRASTEIPEDVHKAILDSLEREKQGTIAASAMKIIEQNIALAKNKSQPICQDTGSIIFYVDCPQGFDQLGFEQAAREAVKLATKKGYLRQNSVDSITGKNDGTNVGPGAPAIHFHQQRSPAARVRARAKGYEFSKQQFRRRLDDANPNPELDKLERDVVETANKLGIGPMGFGGKTTLLGTKIGVLNRLPASYFVSISYMCWAYRRQGVTLDATGQIQKWLY